MSVPILKPSSPAARGQAAALFFRAAATFLAAALVVSLLACKPRVAEGDVASPKTDAAAPVRDASAPAGAEGLARTGPERPSAPTAATPAAPKASPPPPFSERLLAERPFGTRLPKDFAIGDLAAAADRRGALPAARTFLAAVSSARADGFPVDPAWEQTFKLVHLEAILALPAGLGFRLGTAEEGADGSMTHPFALIGSDGRVEGSARFYREGDAWMLAGLEADLSAEAFYRGADDGDFDPERYDWPD